MTTINFTYQKTPKLFWLWHAFVCLLGLIFILDFFTKITFGHLLAEGLAKTEAVVCFGLALVTVFEQFFCSIKELRK